MKRDYVGELSDYIKKNLQKGYNQESLKWALVNQGHSKLEVEKAMKKVNDEITSQRSILEKMKEQEQDVQPIQEPTTDVVPEKQSFWKRLFN